MVIDTDSPEDTQRLIEAYPEVAATRQANTGRGRHFFFLYEEGISNSAGQLLGKGIDIRSQGGFCILPPSLHHTGRRYQWLNKNDLQALPANLREALCRREEEKSRRPTIKIGEKIGEGRRDDTLTRMAGAMRRVGFTEEEILAALLMVNSERCEPPLEEMRVRKVAHSVSLYAPATGYNPTERRTNGR